jgi:hypothetical protein
MKMDGRRDKIVVSYSVAFFFRAPSSRLDKGKQSQSVATCNVISDGPNSFVRVMAGYGTSVDVEMNNNEN